MIKLLNMGCGMRGIKAIKADVKVVTLDINPEVRPDVVHDLNIHPLPFEDEEFDEIMALDVLEHIGKQGDYRFFFAEFGEYWRILKPDGLFHGSVPIENDKWAWGDPGHTRIFSKQYLTYLDQKQYEQVGKTLLTDYRFVWNKSFEILQIVYQTPNVSSWNFTLRKIDG